MALAFGGVEANLLTDSSKDTELKLAVMFLKILTTFKIVGRKRGCGVGVINFPLKIKLSQAQACFYFLTEKYIATVIAFRLEKRVFKFVIL